jgi:hypothetical protein
MKWWVILLTVIFIMLLGFMGVIKLILFVNGGVQKPEITTNKIIESPKPTHILTIAEKIKEDLNKNYVGKEYNLIMDQISNIDSTTTLLGCEKKDGLFGATWTDTFKCSDGSIFKVVKIQDSNKNFILVEVNI